MEQWFEVATLSEIKNDSNKLVTALGQEIVICRYNNAIYAIENRCSHLDLPLEDGIVTNGIIICPFHGAQFSISTGTVISGPACNNIKVFKTKIIGNNILIQLDNKE